MARAPCFPEGQVEALARALGESGSGTDISRVLQDRSLVDDSGGSTKWRRLYWVFLDCQKRSGCANQVIDFIRAFLTPARFVGRSEAFEAHRQELNTILAFSGLNYGSDGQFRKVDPATTIDEAERRVRTMRSKFQGRRMHPEVVKYCRSELMQNNYFHAVFEATKGLAQRIRDMTGVQADSTRLIDRVFATERPMLAMNTLQTETEKSEHKRFAALLKGCFAAVRNPLAYEPKILWEGEDDAADYLSLISLEIFEGDHAADFIDGDVAVIKVNCRALAGDIPRPIPYALAVTVEVAEGLTLPIYTEVRDRLRVRVRAGEGGSV